jgi:hypothetical protein
VDTVCEISWFWQQWISWLQNYSQQVVRHKIFVTLYFRHVRKIAKSDYLLRHVCLSARNNSAPTERIFMKFGIWGFFKKSVEKILVRLHMTRVTVTLHEDVCAFMTGNLSVFFLGWEIFRSKVVERIKTLFINDFSWKSCCLWGNGEEYGTVRQATGDNMIRHRKRARIQKHSKYLLLKSFPRNNGYTNAPRCYVLGTLSVLLFEYNTQHFFKWECNITV